VIDWLTLAAWRLHLTSLDESGSARDDDDLAPFSRETLRTERSLETALDLLANSRSASRPRWGRSERRPAAVDSPAAEPEARHGFDEGPSRTSGRPRLTTATASTPTTRPATRATTVTTPPSGGKTVSCSTRTSRTARRW
jgi:hypothetical protein